MYAKKNYDYPTDLRNTRKKVVGTPKKNLMLSSASRGFLTRDRARYSRYSWTNT